MANGTLSKGTTISIGLALALWIPVGLQVSKLSVLDTSLGFVLSEQERARDGYEDLVKEMAKLSATIGQLERKIDDLGR